MICATATRSFLCSLVFVFAVALPFNAFGSYTTMAAYPSILGGVEIQMQDMSTNIKWKSMLHRFRGQVIGPKRQDPRFAYWKKKLISMRGLDTYNKIESVNSYINQARYVEDGQNWYRRDHWATPIEFFNKGGDCEDFAIAKFFSLRILGVPDENMRLAIVHDRLKSQTHAVLMVYTSEGTLILDNQNQNIVSVRDSWRYQPIISFNQSAQWLHHS